MQLRDTQGMKKGQDIFRKKETIVVSRKENAIIVMLKSTMQMNAES